MVQREVMCLFLGLVLSTYLFSQNEGFYEVNIKDDGVEYSVCLSLFDSSKYELSISYLASEDIIDGVILSSGDYSAENKICLRDKYFGFEMILLFLDEDEIQFVKSFNFLENKVLEYIGVNVDREGLGDTYNNYLHLNSKKFSETKIDNSAYLPKESVSRTYESDSDFHRLVFIKDGFRFYYKDFILLQGDYYIQENKIMLEDNLLKHEFVVTYQFQETVLSGFLPGVKTREFLQH